jgi:hypothetical protein
MAGVLVIRGGPEYGKGGGGAKILAAILRRIVSAYSGVIGGDRTPRAILILLGRTTEIVKGTLFVAGVFLAA